MRQGDGTDLLGADDPRSASIGIIRVDPTDERKDVLTAILAQEELQRRQIAVVLHEQNKAFLHPVDFDGLKDMRRNGLKAEVVFVARGGSGPAEFARQRRFAVYSSLESFANSLRDEAPERENRRGWFGRKQKSAPLAPADNGLKAVPATGVMDMRRPLTILPSASVSPAEFSQARGDTEGDDGEEDIPTLVTSTDAAAGVGGVAGGAGAVWAGASGSDLLQHDDDLLAPPPPLKPAANGAESPSFTPDSAGEKPDMGGTGKTQTPPSIRAVEPAIITYPAQRSRPKSTGKLPAAPPDEDAAVAAAGAPRQVKNGNSGKLRAAMAAGAGGVVGGAAFASAQTPAAPSGTPPGGPNVGAPGGGVPPRRRSRRWLALLLILLTILLLAGIAFASPGGQQIITHIIPSTTTATVTITPKSQPLANDFFITAVTGKPDPTAREVQARIISTMLQNQTASAGATGPLGGRRATGPLLFTNNGTSSVSLSGGTLTGKSGVPIAFGPVTVPIQGITITGTAVNEGVSGDIPAFDIFGSCCGSSSILVRNPAAFSGGVDPKPNSVITQNDINRAINNLVTAAQSAAPGQLKGQVKKNEQVVANTLNCKPNVTADHKAGDVAPKVTVTGTVTCSEEVFDRDRALKQADTALRMQAVNDRNFAGYVPVGDQVITGITKISKLDGNNSLLVQVHANGVWVYDFTDKIQHDLKHAIAGKPESDALTYVKHQPGVLDATIVLSSGSLLPMCSTDQCPEITIKVNAVAGPTGSPTLTPSSPTPTTNPGATPSPTPQNGQGGS